MTHPDSGNDLPQRIAQGTQSAKEEVYLRYHQGLVAFVRRALGERAARISAESVAMSAWGSFLKGVTEKRYQFDHSGALWRLLTTIARHKVYDTASDGKNANIDWDADLLGGRDPTPSEAAAVAETVEKILEGRPLVYGEVLELLLSGCSVLEIASRLDLGRQQVRAIRKYLQTRLERILKKGADC
jgi:DNA-directed RNA polymerase specialized sigma24 family protein